MAGRIQPHRECLTFPCEIGALRPARDVVREAAERIAPVDEQAQWALDLMVSELIANAVIHSHMPPDEPIEIDLLVQRGHLEVGVIDHGPNAFQPQAHLPGAEAPSGRGLALIARLADSWGVERARGRTRVWFTMSLA